MSRMVFQHLHEIFGLSIRFCLVVLIVTEKHFVFDAARVSKYHIVCECALILNGLEELDKFLILVNLLAEFDALLHSRK